MMSVCVYKVIPYRPSVTVVKNSVTMLITDTKTQLQYNPL